MFVLLASLLASPAPMVELKADTVRTVSGISMPLTVDAGGQTLHLNGMALRKKIIVAVYVAGLYLAAPSTKPDEILGADAPRRMVMHFKHDVDKKKMCDAWSEGLENNTANPSADLKGQFGTLCEAMQDIKDGQTMVFTYVPGQGVEVEVNGANRGVIGGKEFADAMLRCWIGPKPGPGEGFKKKLLGLND
jgi:chalcone isomerase-like protein